MAQIKSSALYAITSKTIDSRPNEVIALIRKNGVMIPDGASSDTIDKAFVSLITKSKAFQQQFAQLATKTVMEGDATISFDGSVSDDGAFNKSGFSFDGSVAQDGAFGKSNLSFDASLARDGAMQMSNFKDVSNEVNFEGAFPKSSFDDISDEVNFSGAGLSTSSTSSAPKPPTTAKVTAPTKSSSTSGSGSSSGGSKKSGSGFGSTFTPEFIQGLLATGLSIWAYNKTGKTSDELKGNLDEGRNDPNYNTGDNNNNSNTKGGLSTTGIVLISLGVITAIGVAVYFVRKK